MDLIEMDLTEKDLIEMDVPKKESMKKSIIEIKNWLVKKNLNKQKERILIIINMPLYV